MGSLCGAVVRAGKGLAAWAGVGGYYQLWVGKRAVKSTKGCAGGAIEWICIVVEGRITRGGGGGAACVEGC